MGFAGKAFIGLISKNRILIRRFVHRGRILRLNTLMRDARVIDRRGGLRGAASSGLVSALSILRGCLPETVQRNSGRRGLFLIASAVFKRQGESALCPERGSCWDRHPFRQ